MTLFEEALTCIKDHRGWSEKEADRIREFAKMVAEVESNCNVTACQFGGGPGRGKYQFEIKEGGSGSNITAINRLSQFRNKFQRMLELPPQDAQEIGSGDPDFSRLTEDTQDLLFLVNCERHPLFSLTDLAKDRISHETAWLDYHWAGPDDDRLERSKHWRRVTKKPPEGG